MTDTPDFLKRLFSNMALTEEQRRCGHILSSRMPDGKWFCPSCKLVSEFSLKRGEA